MARDTHTDHCYNPNVEIIEESKPTVSWIFISFQRDLDGKEINVESVKIVDILNVC